MREGWRHKSLDELIDDGTIRLGRGKVISKKDIQACPGSYPVYSSAKNNNGKFGEYGRYMFDEEMITWSVDGGGRLFHRHKHRFSVTNVGGTMRILDASILDCRFLFYALTLLHAEVDFDWVLKAHPSIIRKLYKDIPLPPLLEQERIVAILDEAFAAIATAPTNAEKNLASARELFESRVYVTLERLTSAWSQRRLGEVCENLDSRRVPITKSKREAGTIPYYGASGVVDYVADYLFDEDLLLVSEDGANLLARTYPIAFSISGKAWVNNHAHVLRFAEMARQMFVEYYLNSIDLKHYVSGMAQPKLNQKALNSIPIPWADAVSEVEPIVELFEESERKSDVLSDVYQNKLTNLAELRQSVLHKAFTGELTVDANAAERSLSEAGL